jgi:two-component system, OmpR family, phosphate regulon sensor histidine kinase PhoR
MLWRLLSFLVCQFLGAVAGWYASPQIARQGIVPGLVLGGLIWLLIDSYRAKRLLTWLKVGDASDVALRFGLWGELSDRVRRLLRVRDTAIRDGQNQLQDFLAAFQASPNGVVLLNPAGQIEWCNQMAATHFGLDARRDILQHFGNLVRDPGFAAYAAAHDYQSDVVMSGRDSTPARPLRLSVQLHPYSEGRLLLLSRDVTALEQAEAMRRDFVANVSHEIRTPLTVLGGFVETLQTLALSAQEQRQYLSLMARQADRMQTLVSDLLTLSRLEGRPPPGMQEWVSLPGLMSQLELEGRGLSAVVGSGAEQTHRLLFESNLDVEIAGASNELLSAMGNLVTNAVRYTPPGGEIRVWTQRQPDDGIAFSVSDTGCGIASEHIPRLTERFYRVDRSRSRDTGGTGLGLAIVKHVAQRHGAHLEIDSILGQGSTFTLVFPASRVRSRGLMAS